MTNVLLFIIAFVLVGYTFVWLLRKACHWWDCGALQRTWKKREPNSSDYELHTTDNLEEFDRYMTDVNDWRLEGKKEAQDNPDDC